MAIFHKTGHDDLHRERPSLGDWLNLRTGWYGFVQKNLDEPMPAGVGWWQTLGNLLLTLLVFQFVSGFMLTLYYVPSPDHAHQSVSYINNRAWMGSIVRGIHHYGSSFLVIVIVLHILRTFFWGTYKKPRELTWVFGVLIFGIMLAFSFTGYLLPWDQKAFWATVVGTRMVETVPLVGDKLVVLVRGGHEVGALTLTRFYAIHIMALPLALMGLTAAHLYLVRRLHIAGPVTKQKGKPVKFYPTQLFRDAVVLLVAVGWLLVLAYLAKPELGEVANPARVDFTPKPEWYFLGLYELLKLLPPQLESVGTFFIPMGMIAGMLALPWLDRSESRHPAKRRWIIDVAIVTILGIGILTLKGLLS
ncbi:cytochrome b [Armatimonas rosea]|uniref:Ubiquinol-cytochrome c reductase cytochrome b subunit n=1 Tax=Armatimonas rosea TaxID=685828 RepID=A0A7W9SVX3_ARMRO|nr:cytochrome b N-terminal domain-containing protein [Armatimonas rosea]MBB6053847.1 ubiquinol-cytochrome c reductase cytochrome b subunit [Armatimonas rosea]